MDNWWFEDIRFAYDELTVHTYVCICMYVGEDSLAECDSCTGKLICVFGMFN